MTLFQTNTFYLLGNKIQALRPIFPTITYNIKMRPQLPAAASPHMTSKKKPIIRKYLQRLEKKIISAGAGDPNVAALHQLLQF